MSLSTVLVLGHRFSSLAIENEVLCDLANVLDGNKLTPDQLDAIYPEVRAILLGTAEVLDADKISKLTRCRVITRYGVGVDNVAVEEATKRGILVVNVPEYCTEEVSDHTMALLLAANRRIMNADNAVRSGEWGFTIMKGVARLSTQILGIVGFGRIGQAVTRKALPFVKNVMAFDPFIPVSEIEEQGVEPVDFNTLLHSSDYISIHCPLTSKTKGLFNEQNLTRMKSTSWLINTSRGGIIDEQALVKVLREERIGGAALDVFAYEPLEHSPLPLLDNVILTPHVASYSERSVKDLQRMAAEGVRAVFLESRPAGIVNTSVLDNLSLKREKS